MTTRFFPMEETALDRCPVCGMKVDPATARWTEEVDGVVLPFCNARCRERFRAAPTAFWPKEPAAAARFRAGGAR